MKADACLDRLLAPIPHFYCREVVVGPWPSTSAPCPLSPLSLQGRGRSCMAMHFGGSRQTPLFLWENWGFSPAPAETSTYINLSIEIVGLTAGGFPSFPVGKLCNGVTTQSDKSYQHPPGKEYPLVQARLCLRLPPVCRSKARSGIPAPITQVDFYIGS